MLFGHIPPAVIFVLELFVSQRRSQELAMTPEQFTQIMEVLQAILRIVQAGAFLLAMMAFSTMTRK